jgi:hypothetical protein
MREEIYQIRAKSSAEIFEFISERPKGRIKKRIQYRKIYEGDMLYNLSFGDINSEKNTIDDKVVSNNEDTKKVLATVVSTLFAFMKKHPDAIIYAKGSNAARTRLYQIGISNNFEEINERFTVFGVLSDEDLELFQKNKNYLAFYIKNK